MIVLTRLPGGIGALVFVTKTRL